MPFEHCAYLNFNYVKMPPLYIWWNTVTKNSKPSVSGFSMMQSIRLLKLLLAITV